MLIIQEIQVRWSKREKSGLRAQARNSVPELFNIDISREASAFHHLVRFDEKSDYSDKSKSTVEEFETRRHGNYFGAICVKENDGKVIVSYQYSDHAVGAPRRTVAVRDVLNLEINQWGRIAHTGRFGLSDRSDWRYLKAVYNVAKISYRGSGTIKIGSPVKEFRDIAKLF